MSKSKRARSSKARSASKPRSKAATRKSAGRHRTRANSKQARVLGLLRRPNPGNRRFWPVRCGEIDVDTLARDRDQLWAEAVARYRGGAIWWLEEQELIALAKAEQDHRYQADAWDARIDHWLVFERRRVNRSYAGYDDWQEKEVERASPIADVSVGEILEGALGIEPARWTKADQMRVGAYLKTRQWERYQARRGEFREWRYRR